MPDCPPIVRRAGCEAVGFMEANRGLPMIATGGYVCGKGLEMGDAYTLAIGAGLITSGTGLNYIKRLTDVTEVRKRVEEMRQEVDQLQRMNTMGVMSRLDVMASPFGFPFGMPFGLPVEDLFPPTASYRSLDGRVVITDQLDLLESLGTDPRMVAVRIGTILQHAEKGPLSVDELETLRRAKALVSSVPGLEESLCEAGEEMVTRMNKLIKEYEDRNSPSL